ncbi:hypothetical protein NUM_60030 [Actinocatenispora comari]|uniref:Uncharacterized protein n=1 Tax=Actinocatenispora comari TaxID=2807577 RepID=A0A8J4AGC4_9ACTN|nr:hypothetical protein NUM_60030 [Actinocatenispora comari]
MAPILTAGSEAAKSQSGLAGSRAPAGRARFPDRPGARYGRAEGRPGVRRCCRRRVAGLSG